MATKPENEAAKDVEDDFVILQTFDNMADSTMSNASTIPEKQTFESQEKLSESSEVSSINEKPKHSDTSSSLGEEPNTDSFSSLGDSMINVLPYYESSQFIEKQLELERELGVLGEGDGREKGNEIYGEKGGSASGSGKGEECKGEGDNVGKESGGEKGDEMCSDHIEGGEGQRDDKDYGVERGKGGGKGVKMRRDVVSGSDEGGKVQDDNVKVEGYGEGRPRGGKRRGEMDRGGGDIEGSWMHVEGEAGIGGDGGVQDLTMSIGGGMQKQGGITALPGNMVKEQRNTDDEAMDGESGADTKLVGGEKEKGSKGEDGEDDDEGETKAGNKVEINVEDTQTSHVEDIPSEGQTEVHQEHSSVEDEIPVDDSTQVQDDSSHQVGESRESSESVLGSDDGLGDQGSGNMEGLVAVESSTDAQRHHVTGSPDEPPSSQTEQSQTESANEDCAQPDDGTYNCSGFDHSQANQAGQPRPDLNPPYQDPPRLPIQAQQAEQQAPNELQNPPDDERAAERPPQRNQAIVRNPRASCCSTLFLVAVVGVLFSVGFVFIRPHIPTMVFWPTKGSLSKPIIEIKTKTHVSPSASSLKLVAECKAYNTSYTIQHCQWRQIHPLPTSPGNTVLPGGIKDCPRTTSINHPPTHNVDATLQGLKVPTDLGTYTFELACGHEAGNSATKRVEIWVNELNPPIISVDEFQVVVSTSTGTAKLNVSCRAVQGKIVEKKWEYIDGPPELVYVTPSENGVVQLSQPGIYKFKYRCTDSFSGTALSRTITVHAKPPYVLGIDLGTSTTCMAIIKEDGTRQDIGIYVDDSDVDPCIPSIVAFAQNGELLVGEKALRQAVVNPHSTIYEVKRLMGRSYYDDPDHKFVYRVRPTLKSHSLKGVRAAVEIPCGKFRKKLVQPELISALILRHVADHAQRYLGVAVKDVVISVPAQFDDAQRKATMDAGLISGLNPVKIVNEPTVAAFAANSLTEKLLAASDEIDSSEEEKQRHTIWAVVADIGGGTTDYALMQIQGSYYKVITTDGDKTLGGRDIDIRLTEVMTRILEEKYLGFDLTSSEFQQKLRIECENAKIVLSEKQQYSLTVEYVDQDESTENLPLEHLLTRAEFEEYVSGILEAMIKPLHSLLTRAGGSITETFGQGIKAENIEDLYLVGGTSHIPKLKEQLLSYFSNVKNVRHKDPVQLVSRGAAAFGAALTGLVQVGKMPRIDAVPLPISIAVDMDDMHVIFERNRLYPCIEKRTLTTYTNNQNAIVIKVYEGEGRTADECHFLGEFELSGIPPLPKNVPEIQATFKIDTNGILSVKASYGDMVKGMKLDVYSKSGGMIGKTRDKMHLILGQLMGPSSERQAKCELLEDATPMSVIPVKPRKSNVLKLSVDSEYDSVKMVDSSNPNAMVPAIGMVTVKGLVTDYDSITKETDLDIVLVVDLSGSMAGVPIATMKTVMLHLIDSLKENHRLGIVTYSTNAFRNLELVSCTAGNKNKARDIVNNFWTMGSTNLYGGLLNGLEMAYYGGRRSRVLLFTDGHANDGEWIANDDIIREIVRETTALRSRTQAQVTLSTFGYLGEHDELLLKELAANVGGGTYNFLNENTALAPTCAKVLGDAIHTIAEKIELSITPLDNVQIVEAITNFQTRQESEKLIFEIPSTADQQSRHILLRLAVPPTTEPSIHAGLYRVELAYTNTLTEREEGSEEYLYVARTEVLDVETRSRDVDEQLNRVFVARQIELASKTDNREKSVELLKEAYDKIQKSDSKSHTLSVCLSEDLEQLIQEVEQGDLNTAKKSLQDSLTSHWQEKGGRGSCYVTRKEDKLISIFTS